MTVVKSTDRMEGGVVQCGDFFRIVCLHSSKDDGVLFSWEAGESWSGGSGRHQERSARRIYCSASTGESTLMVDVFLTVRSQRVKVNAVLSNVLLSFT